MKITAVSAGPGKPYYVLQDVAGYPLAQGSFYLCETRRLSLIYGDTREQARERMVFYGLMKRRLT